MKFDVAYRTADGKMAETTVEVSNRNAVYSELRRRGITPVSLSESGARRRREPSKAWSLFLRFVLLAALLCTAAFAVWYFVIADESSKRHLVNKLTPASKIDMRTVGTDSHRKGIGTVRVVPSEKGK
jgi:hypothetical protein